MAESQPKMKFAQKLRQLLSSSFRSKNNSFWTCIACQENNFNEENQLCLCSQTQNTTTTGDQDPTNSIVTEIKPKSILKNALPPLSPATLRKLTKSGSGFLSKKKLSNSSLIQELKQTTIPSEDADARSSLSSTSSKSKRVTFNEDILENEYEPDSTSFTGSTSFYSIVHDQNRF